MKRHSTGITWMLLLALVGCRPELPVPQRVPPPVKLATPVVSDVVPYYYFTGTIAASESVDIRSRVEGYVEHLGPDFIEGRQIQKDTLLYQIDQALFVAQRDLARANLDAADAEVLKNSADYDRARLAAATNAVSKEEVARRLAAKKQSEAGKEAARAKLDEAELNVGYTSIRAPFSGLVGRREIDAGNLVNPGITLLTTIKKLQPIHVYFDVSTRIIIRYLKMKAEGNFDDRNEDDRKPVFLELAGEEGYPHEGYLDFIDNTADSGTGTIQARGLFPNTDGILYPGLFVRIRIPGEPVPDSIQVRERAIGTQLSGKFVLVVKDKKDESGTVQKNIVERRMVKLGDLNDGLRVILSGIEPGDKYIVEGLQRARPGLSVTPMEETASRDSSPVSPNPVPPTPVPEAESSVHTKAGEE